MYVCLFSVSVSVCQGMPVCLWGVCVVVYNKSMSGSVCVCVHLLREGVREGVYVYVSVVSGCVFLYVCAKAHLSCILY